MQYFETNNIGWSFWPWKKMETTNTPYSIKTPPGWDAIRTYTRSGTKPSAAAAQKACDELIENIKLANCVYFPDVVSAIFRRVPGRIEAENYGHEGLNQSYSVRDPGRSPSITVSRSRSRSSKSPAAIAGRRSRGSSWRKESGPPTPPTA